MFTTNTITNKTTTKMKKTIDFYDFRDGFRDAGRKSDFSYEGLCALFDYLEELEYETGREIEFKPVTLSCEYREYANIAEFQREYSGYETMSEIEAATTVIPVDGGGFIIAVF